MKPLRILLPALALTLPLTVLGAVAAKADTLSGSWSGSGYVQPRDGQREKVRCRVNYSPQGASTVAVTATCASASATINQTGSLSKVSDSRYIGDFYNSEYDVSGRIRVSISGNSQTVSFSGSKGSGSLSLKRK